MSRVVEKLKSVVSLFASARCLLATGLIVLLVNPVQAATYYFHNDHLGTPPVLKDQNQEVLWKGEYDPFGRVTETVALVEQNLRFPGTFTWASTTTGTNEEKEILLIGISLNS